MTRVPPARAGRRLVVDLNARARRWALDEESADRLRDAAPAGWSVEIVATPAISDGDGGVSVAPELAAAVREAEVYFGFGISEALLDTAPVLRWVQSAAAGVGSLPRAALAARDIKLTNAAGVMAIPIAEHVVGGVLHFLRGFDVAVAQQRAATWDRAPWVQPREGGRDARPRELGECRVVIVGVRGIGAAVAARCAAFGATCVGVRRDASGGAPPGFARVVAADALDAVLGEADVLVLAAPATAATRGLLDRRRIGLLPTGAIVANAGRGSLVDEPALTEALGAGRLRGAVLDVFAEEPLPAASPLWGLANVLITPHVSATSPGRFWSRMLPLFLDNWTRWDRGAPLRNVVDLEAGY
ncbi:phosphoglycerate dehydrogenase [Gemmatimonadetes bacterium T265]|nr:phosphoglycerate dehydrogenase [Gemmatimonadetes bacterium T265]